MFILPVYFLMLGVASAAAGVYGHRLAAALGLVPDYSYGIIVTAGVAAVFAAIQLAWIAFLRFFFPSRSATPLSTELLSLSAVVCLAPIFLDMRIPGMPDITLPSAIGLFGTADNLVFLGVFVVVHCAFKLMTLFAATRTEPSSRLNSLFWIGACIAAVVGAQWCFLTWRAELFSPRVLEAAELPLRTMHAREVYAEARLLPEGATVVFDIEGRGAEDLVFRFARPENVDTEGAVFANIEVDGRAISAAPFTLDFSETPWAEVRVPTAKFNSMAEECTVSWSAQQDAAWLSQMGFHAPPAPGSELMLSGPRFHPAARETQPQGLVIVAIDGLGAGDIHGAREERPVTPVLAALGDTAIRYTNAFAPAPESAAACMTLLTGLDPIRHNYLAPTTGPLPTEHATLAERLRSEGYVTAAFTEGLPHGGGFARGFDLFDRSTPEAGAKDTLRAAAQWIETHRDQRFFVFVRLSEAASLRIAPHHEALFGPRGGGAPSPRDIHDNALAYTDRMIGEFLERLDGAGVYQTGAVLITGTHGLDLSNARPGRGADSEMLTLSEECLHVPMWLWGVNLRPQSFGGLASLDRVAPMLLEVAGAEGLFNGENLGRYGSYLRDPADSDVISVAGDPVALSMRTGRWRFTWQSGRSPVTGEVTGQDSVKEFMDIHRYAEGRDPGNYFRSESRLAEAYQQQLEDYLTQRLPGGQ